MRSRISIPIQLLVLPGWPLTFPVCPLRSGIIAAIATITSAFKGDQVSLLLSIETCPSTLIGWWYAQTQRRCIWYLRQSTIRIMPDSILACLSVNIRDKLFGSICFLWETITMSSRREMSPSWARRKRCDRQYMTRRRLIFSALYLTVYEGRFEMSVDRQRKWGSKAGALGEGKSSIIYLLSDREIWENMTSFQEKRISKPPYKLQGLQTHTKKTI